jgi:two-component system, OmpR family, response regulator QseB
VTHQLLCYQQEKYVFDDFVDHILNVVFFDYLFVGLLFFKSCVTIIFVVIGVIVMRVLLVEDDEILGEGLEEGLKQMGYTVDWVTDGVSASNAVTTNRFDVVVLDIRLPQRDGLEVLRRMRAAKDVTPVILLTARNTVIDQIEGLDAGADYYLDKPVELESLEAVIRSLRRTVNRQAESVYRVNTVSLDPAQRSVKLSGTDVTLSRREFSLLSKLMERAGSVVTKEVLIQTLYGWEEEIDSNAIEVHVYNLRKKFRDALTIQTIRGVGYLLKDE